MWKKYINSFYTNEGMRKIKSMTKKAMLYSICPSLIDKKTEAPPVLRTDSLGFRLAEKLLLTDQRKTLEMLRTFL